MQTLPKEIKSEIFKYLSLSELRRVRNISTSYQNLIDNIARQKSKALIDYYLTKFPELSFYFDDYNDISIIGAFDFINIINSLTHNNIIELIQALYLMANLNPGKLFEYHMIVNRPSSDLTQNYYELINIAKDYNDPNINEYIIQYLIYKTDINIY